jgi:hypothetical protein
VQEIQSAQDEQNTALQKQYEIMMAHTPPSPEENCAAGSTQFQKEIAYENRTAKRIKIS